MSTQPQPQAPNPLKFNPDASLLSALFPEPSQQQAFAALLQGFSNHNFGIMDRLMSQQENAFNERLTPLDSYFQQQDTDNFYNEIARHSPELADHMDTVRTLQLKPTLGENPTRADLVKAFAEAAKGHLGKYVPTLQTPTEGAPVTTPSAGSVKPATTPPVTPPQPGSNSATRPSVPPTPALPVDSNAPRTIGADDMAAILGS